METKTTESKVGLLQAEINKQLSDPIAAKSLVEVTFKGLEMQVAKRAMLEGMMRGFTFTDFLEKNVYAIPYSGSYSLVTSIDYSRKIGAKSGVVGVDAPVYQENSDGSIKTCAVTVRKRFADGFIGSFTAEVYFKEYTTGKNLWTSKPRTMISKVAEMHALRKACPEELSQAYVEEEVEKPEPIQAQAIDIEALEEQLRACKTQDELNRVWADMPGPAKVYCKPVMEEVKAIILAATADIV